VPEGDTLFRTAATLQKAIGGRVVTRFESVLTQLTRVDVDTPLAGRTVEKVEAHGKHLLMRFSGDLTLRTHLRMNGSWHVYRPGERWQRPRFAMRIVVATDAWEAVGFDIPVAEFLTPAAERRHRDLSALGPDLLGAGFDATEAVRRLRERADRTIEVALLDQRALAGIGNVYKSEVLFACGVWPFAPVAALDDATLHRLVDTARTLLRANVAPGDAAAITTYRGLRRTTRRSDPGARLWVYGRGRKPCRNCGTPIEVRATGPDARLTYWCPQCQAIGARRD
jgi:endonuclease-8